MKSMRFGLLILALAFAYFGAHSSITAQATIPLSQLEFLHPQLAVSSAVVRLDEVLGQLPNATAWEEFKARHSQRVMVAIDPRSGTPATMGVSDPLIPGTGIGNQLTLVDLGVSLGYPVSDVTPAVVGDRVRQYVVANRDVFAIATDQLGPPSAAKVHDDLWQVSIPQVARGIPVRRGRVLGTLNHGNLALIGTEYWGDVRIDLQPSVTADDALRIGFQYLGGQQASDSLVQWPQQEVVPIAPPGRELAYTPGGPIGDGYGHLLVWTFAFERSTEPGRWELMVDAHSGSVVAFEDTYLDAQRTIKGSVYPATNTEVCQTIPPQCGEMKSGFPMPWADYNPPKCTNEPATSCAHDSDCPQPGGVCQFFFANGGGIYDASGTATTTLKGKYAEGITYCNGPPGPVSVSSAGDIDLDGTTGNHDCEYPAGTPVRNQASLRTSYYEVNRMAEIGRGWLPNNNWLKGLDASGSYAPVRVNVEFGAFCLPAWTGSAIRMGVSGTFEPCAGTTRECRDPGEIASAVNHEWGHGLDQNDAMGLVSNTSEAYGDVAAILRQQGSCFGHGAFTKNPLYETACGPSLDGQGWNADMAGCGLPSHCTTDCSGAREADWRKHQDGIPDTALGFVCGSCSTLVSGLCGRDRHCSSAPVDQAAWDLATSDLRSAPFSYDSGTAFIIANKLFYQGSGNIGNWYECDCAASTSSACGSGSGYMGWLTVDDDNGYLGDGTPHMTAIYNAFNRHGIACTVADGGPTPQNSGCAGAPTIAPSLTAIQGTYQVSLSWTADPGAWKYWVFRAEGHAGCNSGRALIQETLATSYTDTEVADGRLYSYSVMAVGQSNACFGRSSDCKNPDVLASSDVSTSPGEVIGGDYASTHSSDDVREAIRETLDAGTQRLVHTWQFQNVPSGGHPPYLVIEGYRPNSSNDDFQFYYSSDGGMNYTLISGAIIKKPFELTGGSSYPFGVATLSGSILIQLRDTNQGSDISADTVYVDFLAIRAQE